MERNVLFFPEPQIVFILRCDTFNLRTWYFTLLWLWRQRPRLWFSHTITIRTPAFIVSSLWRYECHICFLFIKFKKQDYTFFQCHEDQNTRFCVIHCRKIKTPAFLWSIRARFCFLYVCIINIKKAYFVFPYHEDQNTKFDIV